MMNELITNDQLIGLLIGLALFLLACCYVLFWWEDPAIERYEEGLRKERDERSKQSIE